jgi:hypothetical protein
MRLPERFESKVYPPELAKLMKDAFAAAWPKVGLIGKNRELTRQLLASAIIDQVDAGERNPIEIAAAAVVVLASAGKALSKR